MDSKFSMLELYDVKLKAISPMTIGGIDYEPKETVYYFDKIVIANFTELNQFIAARGGFKNRARVLWEDKKQINLSFTQGVFSEKQFALMCNGDLKTESTHTEISYRETLETNEDCELKLKYTPVGDIFIYNKGNGQRIKDFIRNGDKLILRERFLEVIVDYTFEYAKGITSLTIGGNRPVDYFYLEGRTKTKDDDTGAVRTGIIRIYKMAILSNLALTLGKEAKPMVADFTGIGFPIGNGGVQKIMDIEFLADNVDSDF